MIPRWLQRHFMLMIIAIVAVSRLPAMFYPLVSPGEADLAVQTVGWMNGGIPYVDFVHDRMLVIHAWFRWIFEIFGEYNMLAVHLMDVLLVLITIGGLYIFARYASGEKVARWAAIIYAVFQSLGSLPQVFATTPESLMNAFAVFGAYVFFKSMREDRPGMSLFAGMLIGCSVVAKHAGMALVAACAVSMVTFWYEQREHRWHRYVEEFFLLVVGLFFPLVLLVSYVSDVGGLAGFMRWPWGESFIADAPGEAAWHFFAITGPLWILAGWVVVHFVRERRWRTEFVFLVTWIVVAVVLLAAERALTMHSVLQLLPPLAMLAAIGVVDRWEAFFRKRRVRKKRRQTINAVVASIVLIVPFAIFLIVHVLEVSQLKDRYSPMKGVASYLASTTSPDERVFVWGDDASIYFFSRRRPASRFTDCTYLTGTHSARGSDLNAWVMLKRDFERNPPAVIIDLAPTRRKGFGAFPIGRQLFLANYVHDNYRLAKTLYGARIFKWRPR